ncbi:reverse transcriptase domain-containing protein [Artemisia annua]|uniref:Reverse transcriptase domain-containing protein n=1 Tax=Artemisia annua TaxID=35608 RepID=A0A2U1LKH4_ARTAN|nr:reverse transcriptase domain-containing protein [Artemisia annua]
METIKEAKYKKKMVWWCNKRVRPVSFRPGEYVYRRNEAIKVKQSGKLDPTWEGLYQVLEAFQSGSYKLDQRKIRTCYSRRMDEQFVGSFSTFFKYPTCYSQGTNEKSERAIHEE